MQSRLLKLSMHTSYGKVRSQSIFKVKGQISRSLGLYKEFWHLYPCGQDIARTMWPKMIKLIMYTSYGMKKSKVAVQGHWAFIKNSGTWILVGRIYQELCSLGCSNVSCTLHTEKGRSLFIFKVKDQISRSLGFYKVFRPLDLCGQDISRYMQSRLLKLSMHTSHGKGRRLFIFKVKFQGHWALIKNSGT